MRRLGYLHYPIKLDIGCGRNTINDFVGLDVLDFNQDVVWDAREGLPFPNDSVSEIHSSHFFEHLDLKEIKYVLDEIVRVSKPNSRLTLIVPHSDTVEAHYLCHYSLWNEKVIKGICIDHANLELVSTRKEGINLCSILKVKKGGVKAMVVTGCQRAGTRIIAKIMAEENNLSYVDEVEFDTHDEAKFREKLKPGFVVHAPAMSYIAHKLPDDVEVIWANRDKKDILKSMERIDWSKDSCDIELKNYGIAGGREEVIDIKNKVWNENKKNVKNYREVDFNDFGAHKLWKNNRENFLWNQT